MALKLEEKDALVAYNDGSASDQALLKRLYPDFFNRDIIDRIKTI